MSSVFKGTDQQKKRIRTPKKIGLLIPPLLIYPVRSNHLLPTRKKTRAIKEVLSATMGKDKVKAKTPL